MDTFDILHPGPWFGPKIDLVNPLEERSSENTGGNFLEICTQLKSGDFSARSLLEKFILLCTDVRIKRQAIRLYCYVARHEDIDFLGNLLGRCDHDEVFSIVTYAPHTLSPQIVPYLFALLEEYEGTSISEPILSSINSIFPFQYDGGDVSISELGEQFAGFANNLDAKKYYYGGVEAFAGHLTKNLIETAAIARQQKSLFPLADVPTLLSIWSGERCPVFYGEPVADVEFEDVMNFSKNIASMQWVRGEKYFYGCQVR